MVLGVVAILAWSMYLLPPILLLDDTSTSVGNDFQMLSWLAGRWDLPRGIAGGEGFEVGGRYYIYFGPTPAALRLPFAALVARFAGKIGFVSVFLAATLGLWAGLAVVGELIGRPPGPVHVLALAGPAVLITSRPYIYYEAIGWGASFALLASWQMLRYLRRPTLARLIAVAVAGALAVFARSLWLPGMVGLLALAALAAAQRSKRWLGLPSVPKAKAHAVVAGAAILLILGGTLGFHRAKFGDWGLVPPISRHVAFQDPQRLARIGGRLFHLGNLRTGIYNYFSPGAIGWRSRFPWITPVAEPRIFPEARLDGVEIFVSLPHAMGALLVMTALGLWRSLAGRASRSAALVVACLGLSASMCFLFVGLCGRYLYDFLPALAVGAALGWSSVPSPGRGGRIAIGLLAAYNLAVCLAVSFAAQWFQRPTAPRRQELQRVAEAVDGRVLPPSVLDVDGRSCRAKSPGHFRFRMFPRPGLVEGDDPVLVTGAALPGANLVLLRRFADGTGAYVFRAHGHPDISGRRFVVEPGPHELDVWFDPALGVFIRQDALAMLSNGRPAHAVVGEPAWLGRDPLGAPGLSPAFAGRFECAG
jgi:hypothetical protein